MCDVETFHGTSLPTLKSQILDRSQVGYADFDQRKMRTRDRLLAWFLVTDNRDCAILNLI